MSISKIKLVDRFLLLIMLILVIETFVGLFAYTAEDHLFEKIDVVTRTAIASIFGYFISSNFLQNHQSKTDKNNEIDIKTDKSKKKVTPENDLKIMEIDQELYNTEKDKKNKQPASTLQVMVVGISCLLSVFMLFIIRFLRIETSFAHATLFQFRDILCGCIGFLIGMPSEKMNK